MPKIIKPSPKFLEKFILEESAKVKNLMTPEEKSKEKVEVGGDTKKLNSLENQVDFYKVLKIKEAKLKRSLKRVQEQLKTIREAKEENDSRKECSACAGKGYWGSMDTGYGHGAGIAGICKDCNGTGKAKNKKDVKESKKKDNPWAICTSQVGRGNKDKYEQCVQQVKKNLKNEADEEGEKDDEISLDKLMKKKNLSGEEARELMKRVQKKYPAPKNFKPWQNKD